VESLALGYAGAMADDAEQQLRPLAAGMVAATRVLVVCATTRKAAPAQPRSTPLSLLSLV
jgi:hypothetical protein